MNKTSSIPLSRLLSSFLFALFTMLLSSCISDNEPHPADYAIKTGERIPDFSVTVYNGSVISTESLRGKKSIIVFFNTSCPDCRKELPQIQTVYETILGNDLPVNLICIARAESAESIISYWRKNSLTLPFSPQKDTAIFNLFAQYTIPRVYLTDENLVITSQWDDSNAPSAAEILAKL